MHRTEGLYNSSNMFDDGPPGTRVEENWLNAVQEEIANVIEEAGITLKIAGTETQTQLKEALDALYFSFAHNRAQFAYVSATQISIEGGAYTNIGTVSQILVINSTITYTLSSSGINQWIYLYIDHASLTSNIVTGANLADSSFAPTYDDTKKGWYSSGGSQCIFAVYLDGSGNISRFAHDGDYVSFSIALNSTPSTATIAHNTTQTYTVNIPSFARRLECSMDIDNGTLNGLVYWTTTGAGALRNIFAYYMGSTIAGHRIIENLTVLSDSSLQIDVYQTTGANLDVQPRMYGWYFPVGM